MRLAEGKHVCVVVEESALLKNIEKYNQTHEEKFDLDSFSIKYKSDINQQMLYLKKMMKCRFISFNISEAITDECKTFINKILPSDKFFAITDFIDKNNFTISVLQDSISDMEPFNLTRSNKQGYMSEGTYNLSPEKVKELQKCFL